MPVPGFRNFTIRKATAEKLERYAAANGLKLVQLVDKLAEKIEPDVPLMYLMRAVESSRTFMLKEAVDAEYLRDLLVRLYFNLRGFSIELQTLMRPGLNLGPFSFLKSSVAPIVEEVTYQAARLEKVLNETYPRGWATPLPPLPVTYAFLGPQRNSGQEYSSYEIQMIKERLLDFLKNVESNISEAMKILEKLKSTFPQLWESVGEALRRASLALENICANLSER